MKRPAQKCTRADLMAIDKVDLVDWILERTVLNLDEAVLRIRTDAAMRKMRESNDKMLAICDQKKAIGSLLVDSNHKHWYSLSAEWDKQSAIWDAANAELAKIREVAA